MYNNSNEMVRGYFMRQSEGGYAPKNFKYNNKNNNKNKKIRGVQALLNPSIMMQKPLKKKKSSSKK
jgi:hypothetical protein